MTDRPATRLEDLLAPRSIAIVGASDDPRRIGGRPLRHMIEQRFEGAVWPVNPRRDRVQGLPAYPSLSDVPDRPDFVLIAVPAPDVAGVLREAVAKGARTALVFSSGFAETGPAGAAREAELAEIARAGGVRLIGPNCLGAFNAGLRFYPTFSATIDRATPTPGGISIASQSGAYGSHIFIVSHLRGLGIRYWLTTGNEADLHVAEAIGLLAVREDVHTIMAYAESIKDGPVLASALETARAARKPVIFMKVGRSPAGAAAAASHTASLAGEDAVYDAVLRTHGAWRARTTEEMLDIAYAARPRIYPAGQRVGIVTISGGAGVLMADDAAALGLEVAPMPPAAQAKLRDLVPFANPANPVDVTAQAFNDLAIVPQFLRAMLDEGGYDGLVGFWTSVAGSPILAEPLLEALRRVTRGHSERSFLHCLVAPEPVRTAYEAAGLPCFEDPSRAMTAMAALMWFGRAFADGAPARPEPLALPALPEGPLGEREAQSALSGAGLSMIGATLATSADEALQAAAKGNVALKLASPDVPHKSDIGGVALDVTPATAAAAFERIVAAAGSARPDARIDGVLVSPMVPEGVDLILGARRDPVFGPVVLAGLGGIFAEALDDTVLRPAPFDVTAARTMLDALRGRSILDGARGRPPVDLDALAEAISRFSRVAAGLGPEIDSLEINPLRALPDGCVGLDALIVRRAS